MQDTTIAFSGAGNMASALFGGLIKQGFAASQIRATDPSETCREQAANMGVIAGTDNVAAIKDADAVVIAVKPQVLKQVLAPLQNALAEKKPLLISIAAGIDLASLQNWAGPGVPIVRCMPNTPALVQAGATGLYASDAVSDQQQLLAENILDAVGISVWVAREADLDSVTAVSGSGPAYFFMVMEAMQQAGEKLGLPAAVAKQLTLQTALGAAKMALESDVSPAELRRRVSSPGGTTLEAIKTFEAGGLVPLFEDAMTNCAARSVELAKELGD